MGNDVRRRKRREEKWKKTIGILLCITAMATIITISALYQRNPQPSVVPADEYFETQVNVILAETNKDNITILIQIVSFNLTAIKGDAHNVIVRPPGYIPEEEWPHYFEIRQGKSVLVEIEYHDPHFYPCDKGEDGYSFPITILGCREAYGEIILNFTDFFPLKRVSP